MATSQVVLSTTQYVRVNIGLNPLMVQAHRDSVRLVHSDNEPARRNTAFHMLDGGSKPLQFPFIDTNVWVLAMSETSSLVVTEFGFLGI